MENLLAREMMRELIEAVVMEMERQAQIKQTLF